MSRRDFLEDFVDTSLWSVVPAKHRFRYKKDSNAGMKESHRLALTMGGVIDRSLDDTDGLQTSDYGSYQIFEKGDLAFKLIDLQNIKTSRVGLVPRRGIMSPAYIRLTPTSDEVFPEFYYWYFYAAYLGNIFNGLGGGIRQNLSQTELLEFPVPKIPVSDQTAIARFLDHQTGRIDGLIEKKTRFIALLKEKRAAVITHAVTKGINPDVPMKDSGQDWIGAVPRHWEVLAAARLFDERDERSKTGNEELLTVSHLTGVTPRSEKTVHMIEAESTVGYKKCLPGDLVVNTLWAWMGAMGTARILGIASPAYNVYTPRRNLLDPRYIDYLVRLPVFAKEVTRFSKGVWSSRLRLYPEGLREVRFPVPPLQEQEKLADHLDQQTTRIDGLITLTERSIDLLREKRAALITAAVTGKIDVRTAA
jgi:type I restriction enzyme, S subunit